MLLGADSTVKKANSVRVRVRESDSELSFGPMWSFCVRQERGICAA